MNVNQYVTNFKLVGMEVVELHLLQICSSFQVHLVTLHQEYKTQIINIKLSSVPKRKQESYLKIMGSPPNNLATTTPSSLYP